MQHITFIHVSDLHLDYFPPVRQEQAQTDASAQNGLPEQSCQPEQNRRFDEVCIYQHEASYGALKNLVSLCEEIKPQFLVFSGDIHEHGLLSLKARYALTEFFAYLQKNNIPFYYACGNHDHLGQNDSFFEEFENVWRFDGNWGYFTYPPQKKSEKNAEAPLCTLFGISHNSRKELKNLVKDFSYDSLAGRENLPETPFNIGVLHASVHNQEQVKNTDKHVVALCREGDFRDNPEKAQNSIENSIKNNMDYWALGHIHEPLLLQENPPLMYAGAMQATRMSETGMRGAIVVKMAKQSHAVKEKDRENFQPARISTVFYPLAPLEVYNLSLKIDENAEIALTPANDIPKQKMQVGKFLEENQTTSSVPVESREDCLLYFTEAFAKEYAKIHSNPLCTTRLFTLYLEGEHYLYHELQEEEFLAELQSALEKYAKEQITDTKIFVRSVKSLVRPCFHYEIAHKREDLLGEVFRVLEDVRQDPEYFAEIFRKIEHDFKKKNDPFYKEMEIFSGSDKYTQTQMEQFRASVLHQCESICVKVLEPK